MTKDYDYLWEKLHNGYTTLAEDPGPIRERLAAAMEAAHTVFDDEPCASDLRTDDGEDRSGGTVPCVRGGAHRSRSGEDREVVR